MQPQRRDTGNKMVRKSNELVEARYKFSIWSMRVLLKIISMIDPEDEDFKPYNVYVGELVRDYGLENFGDAYALLKEGAEAMVGKTMDIPSLVGDRVEFGKVTMVSSVLPKIDERRNRYIQLRFDPEIKPHLLNLKSKFLQYDIRNVLKLQSVHSVRIYELLKQFEKIARRRFDLQTLKEILGLYDDEGKPQYPMYANFKQRVLEKARKDLDEHTDISFHYEEVKQGRAVTDIIFYVTPNPRHARKADLKNAAAAPALPETPALPPTPISPSALPALAAALYAELEPLVLQKWGVSASTLSDLLLHHEEAQIRQAIQVTQRAQQAGKVRSSIAGYFVNAVKKGYTDEVIREQNKKKAREEREKLIRQREKDLHQLEDEFMRSTNEIVRELVEADESVREQAILRVKTDMVGYIGLKYKTTAAVRVEDFRYDAVLRAAVINNIRDAHREKFKSVEEKYMPLIEQSKREIATLKAG